MFGSEVSRCLNLCETAEEGRLKMINLETPKSLLVRLKSRRESLKIRSSFLSVNLCLSYMLLSVIVTTLPSAPPTPLPLTTATRSFLISELTLTLTTPTGPSSTIRLPFPGHRPRTTHTRSWCSSSGCPDVVVGPSSSSPSVSSLPLL